MKKDNSPLIDTIELKKDLKLSKGEATLAVTKAAINLVPILGGPTAELLSAAIMPSLLKRRNNGIIMLADAINELSDRRDESSFEKLPENEMFITTVMHASQIAIRNHQKEKLTALKNAVLNSAINIDIEEDLQIMFLDFIDSFTITHLKFLKFFNKPKSKEFIDELDKEIGREGNGRDESGYFVGYRLDKALEYIFPELKGQSPIYYRVLKDLDSKDLLHYGGTGLKVYPDTKLVPTVADLGELFLAFITSPKYD